MASRLNVAIVGCGGISKSHLPNMLKTPEMRVWATMDVVEAAARERAEEGGAQYWTTDLDRVLSDDDVDAVAICATHDTHTELAVQATEAGKHVFLEKPPAMTIEEAKRLQRAAHETGVQMMSGWWFKHSPVTKRLRSVIKQPYSVLFTLRIPGEAGQGAGRPRWALRQGRHPGQLRVQPSLDMARDALAAGRGLCPGFRWEGHQFLHDHDSVRQRPARPHPYSVLLAAGGSCPSTTPEVHAGPISAATTRFYNLVFEGTDEPGIEENEYHNGFDEEMEMFARLCLEGGPNPMDMWEACVPTFVFEKAVESMRTRRPVPLDLEQEMYLPDGKLPASIATFGDV